MLSIWRVDLCASGNEGAGAVKSILYAHKKGFTVGNAGIANIDQTLLNNFLYAACVTCQTNVCQTGRKVGSKLRLFFQVKFRRSLFSFNRSPESTAIN